MKNVKVCRRVRNQGVCIPKIAEIIAAVVTIGLFLSLSLTGVVQWAITLPKTAKEHYYEPVSKVRIYSGPVGKSEKVAVTLVDDIGKASVNISTLRENQYTYTRSFDGTYFPDPEVTDLDIKLFPGIMVKEGDITTLWRRVTLYEVPGQTDFEEVSAYYVGLLPSGFLQRYRLRLVSEPYAESIPLEVNE